MNMDIQLIFINEFFNISKTFFTIVNAVCKAIHLLIHHGLLAPGASRAGYRAAQGRDPFGLACSGHCRRRKSAMPPKTRCTWPRSTRVWCPQLSDDKYAWVLEDGAELVANLRREVDPYEVYRDAKLAWKLSRAQLAVLRELCAWREQQARAS